MPSKGKNGMTKPDYHREVTLSKLNKVVAMTISDTQVEVKTQSINEKFFAGVHACVAHMVRSSILRGFGGLV